MGYSKDYFGFEARLPAKVLTSLKKLKFPQKNTEFLLLRLEALLSKLDIFDVEALLDMAGEASQEETFYAYFKWYSKQISNSQNYEFVVEFIGISPQPCSFLLMENLEGEKICYSMNYKEEKFITNRLDDLTKRVSCFKQMNEESEEEKESEEDYQEFQFKTPEMSPSKNLYRHTSDILQILQETDASMNEELSLGKRKRLSDLLSSTAGTSSLTQPQVPPRRPSSKTCFPCLLQAQACFQTEPPPRELPPVFCLPIFPVFQPTLFPPIFLQILFHAVLVSPWAHPWNLV